ncbi:retrovirus-related Pol polyprotein from transposon 412 [Trichonephila clavipes]|nr:retrovirus-related Pol polyprotein from transposon 412 [Trichonephila clavipes]
MSPFEDIWDIIGRQLQLPPQPALIVPVLIPQVWNCISHSDNRHLYDAMHARLHSGAVRSAGCKCLPFLLVKSAREVPAFRFFPEKDKEEVSSVFTCNVKAGDKKKKVAEDRWVSQLIPLLPIEIAEIVAKEPLEKSDDYPHIKNLLLARFQLTPIALRDRFESHQRRPGAMWADLVFELRSYLDNWLAGMKVGDFAALKSY